MDGDERDVYLAALITAARQRLEHETRRSFLRQRWRAWITGDFGACLPVSLPRPRLMDDAVLLEYRTAGQVWAPYASATVTAGKEPAQLWTIATPGDIVSPDHDGDAVWRASYWAGYGTSTASVPGPLKAAVMMLVAHLHEHPEIIISGNTSQLPLGLGWLLDPYRVPWEGAIK